MKTITVAELKKRLDNKEVFLIDVREPIEHRSERIDGACLIPLAEIDVSHIPDRTKPVVIHCRSGKRSAQACAKLLEKDFNLELYSLEGGIAAWSAAGFEVKKNITVISLERQTQLVAGILALGGTLLGSFYNPDFYIIPGIVGGGLAFSGLTGWCTMTKILAKMPWNR